LPPYQLRAGQAVPAPPVDSALPSHGLVSARQPSTVSNPLLLNEAPLPYGSREPKQACPTLNISRATRNNLKDFEVTIPLERFVCITGVSGSGKTTLVREVLLPALTARLEAERSAVQASDRLPTEQNGDGEESESTSGIPPSALLEGAERIGQVVLVDQSSLGKTPRSNPAVYIGAFDDLREFFAQSEPAKQRGLNASAFSFNSSQGQCERCRGAGFEKIEMQFLSDVFIRCPDCQGRRYRAHILEVRVGARPKANTERVKGSGRKGERGAARRFSIADLLDATVEDAIVFLSSFPESRPARRAVASLRLLEEVGLGYLKLGQPINTLSGGESQRLKLVRHLAEVVGAGAASENERSVESAGPSAPALAMPDRSGFALPVPKPILFLFDEPTTGLHFEDVRVLLKVFQRLVGAGHSVLVIEHNLDVIKSADWIIDLGPEAGDLGGQLVAEGTPETVAGYRQSHTGNALAAVLADTAFCARE
jgi:excinuclease ABC subunit A